MQVEKGFFDIPGARLYYEVAGEGRPLVLIHAGVADCRMWDDQFLEFAQSHRVLRYDTRGYGQSVTEDVAFSNREDLDALLTHLRIDRASLVGVSRGGTIAIDFTVEHSERVSALIPVASGLSGHSLGAAVPAAEQEAFDQMEALWKERDFDHLAELEVRMWVDGPGQPATRVPSTVRERVRAMILHTYRTHQVEGRPQPLTPPAIGRLGEIRVPTLVIVGDLDTAGVLAAADVLVRDIHGARKVVIPGTAHMLNMEKPLEFTRVVMSFLRGLH